MLACVHRSAGDEDAVCETKEEAPEEASNLPRRKISNNTNNLNSNEMKKGVSQEGSESSIWHGKERGRGEGEARRRVWVCAFRVCGALSALATLQGCFLHPRPSSYPLLTRRVSSPLLPCYYLTYATLVRFSTHATLVHNYVDLGEPTHTLVPLLDA